MTALRDMKEIFESSLPVVVELHATWCPPCRVIEPIIDRLAAAYAGRVRVIKVDTDQHPDLAVRFQVRAVPTVHAVVGGRVVGSVYGAAPPSRFEALFEELVSRHGLVAEAAARP